jgi:hypothetical protein
MTTRDTRDEQLWCEEDTAYIWPRMNRLLADRRALKDEIAAVVEALDQAHAPTESGGVRLAPAGRLRALRSQLVVEANRLRGRAEKAERALARLAYGDENGEGRLLCSGECGHDVCTVLREAHVKEGEDV